MFKLGKPKVQQPAPPPPAKPREVLPFVNVRFPAEHPARPPAAHEVGMNFVYDSDAEAWRDWWEQAGAMAFARWLAARAD